MRLECIKGYTHEEKIVCLQGDIVVFNGNEDEMLILHGAQGWCEGIKLLLEPKIVAEHFKFKGLSDSCKCHK